MRILLAPDLHCYYSTYERIREGVSTRYEEWETLASALVQRAREHEVDLAVFPGDFFTDARPGSLQLQSVVRLLKRFEAAGIPCVGCAGNHDLAGPGRPGPTAVLAEVNPEWGHSRPTMTTVAGCQIGILPAVKPQTLVSDEVPDISSALLAIARGLAARRDPDKPSVLIGHWTISGAQCSSGQVLGMGSEPTLPVGELIAMGWDAVLFGHIHKPQRLNGCPPVLYSGALQRIDWGEEHDERGFYIIDLDAKTVGWHDLPAKRLVTVDWTGPADIPLVRDAIVRVRYKLDPEHLIDESEIVAVLHQFGADHVAAIQPEVVREVRARAEVSESTGPMEALEQWLGLRDLPDARRDAVTTAARTLLEGVGISATD